MKTINAKEAANMENPHKVKASKLYDTENAQVIHMTLAPGESLVKHTTPVDVFFYILEGNGVVVIGDEEKEVGPDTLIDSPAGIPHTWHNRSEAPIRFLVVKVPRPAK